MRGGWLLFPLFWLFCGAAWAEAPPAAAAAPEPPAVFAGAAPAAPSPTAPKNGYTVKCSQNFSELFKCHEAAPDSKICIPAFAEGVSHANQLWNQLPEGERAKIRIPAEKARGAMKAAAAALAQDYLKCLKEKGGGCKAAAAAPLLRIVKKNQAAICGG